MQYSKEHEREGGGVQSNKDLTIPRFVSTIDSSHDCALNELKCLLYSISTVFRYYLCESRGVGLDYFWSSLSPVLPSFTKKKKVDWKSGTYDTKNFSQKSHMLVKITLARQRRFQRQTQKSLGLDLRKWTWWLRYSIQSVHLLTM